MPCLPFTSHTVFAQNLRALHSDLFHFRFVTTVGHYNSESFTLLSLFSFPFSTCTVVIAQESVFETPSQVLDIPTSSAFAHTPEVSAEMADPPFTRL